MDKKQNQHKTKIQHKQMIIRDKITQNKDIKHIKVDLISSRLKWESLVPRKFVFVLFPYIFIFPQNFYFI